MVLLVGHIISNSKVCVDKPTTPTLEANSMRFIMRAVHEKVMKIGPPKCSGFNTQRNTIIFKLKMVQDVLFSKTKLPFI